MGDADGDIVEQTKSHGARSRRVMARWTHRAKRRAAFAPDDEVGGQHRGARGVTRRGERIGIERGVGIEIVDAGARASFFDHFDIARRMHPFELLAGRFGSAVVKHDIVETGGDEPVADRIEPFRTFRMVRPHVVKAAGRMCDECDRHESRKSNGENAPTRGREATTKCSASPAGMPRTGPLAGACYSGIFLAACWG